MNDASRREPARGPISLIPGVIYECTPKGTSAVDPVVDLEPPEVVPASTPLARGLEVVPGYRLAEPIGAGCTGEVWKAIGPGGVAVALKFINATLRGAEAELQALAQMLDVRHANLVTIFAIWQRDGWTAIGMDLADGSLLERYEAATADGKPGLDFAELVDVLRQAARGIDFLNKPRHPGPGPGPAQKSVAFVHRDIKPQNLLLVGSSVKVGDFGLVKRLANRPDDDDDGPGEEGIESLVTAYTSPELRRGEASSRSDQYSLAATYCHLRGGRAPTTSILKKPAAGQPGTGEVLGTVDVSMLPPSERPAVARALAINPKRRWPSCSAFVEGLVASAQAPAPRVGPVAATSGWGSATAPPPKRTRRFGPAILASLAMLAAFTLIWSQGPIPTSLSPATAPQPEPVETPAPSANRTSELDIDALLKTVAITPAPVPGPAPTPAADLLPSLAEQMNAEVLDEMVATAAQGHAPGPLPSLAEQLGTEVFEEAVEEVAPASALLLSGSEIKATLLGWAKLALDGLDARFASARTRFQAWVRMIPRPVPTLVKTKAKAKPTTPNTATIIVRMPSSKAELIVRGEVGRGNPDEWYGPRRVIHTPPIDTSKDYLIGAFWTDPSSKRMSRSQPIRVEPGRLYEVDLRSEAPTAQEVSHPPAS